VLGRPASGQKKSEILCNASSLFCTSQQDERKKHLLGMAVVAKGVSPPDLGLWLVSFFASSETESAAQPGRALGFLQRFLSLFSIIKFVGDLPSMKPFVFHSIFQKEGSHCPNRPQFSLGLSVEGA
jgi:hypothetical protein